MQVKGFPEAPGGASGTVPDVTGMTEEEAVKTLEAANFTAIVEEGASIEPEGTVFEQDPKGGARVPLGSAVTITVSNGKAPTVLVPNVVEETEADATDILEGAGFVVNVVYQEVFDPLQAGIVLSQDPKGGSKKKTGTTVTIVVGQLSPSPPPTPGPP